MYGAHIFLFFLIFSYAREEIFYNLDVMQGMLRYGLLCGGDNCSRIRLGSVARGKSSRWSGTTDRIFSSSKMLCGNYWTVPARNVDDYLWGRFFWFYERMRRSTSTGWARFRSGLEMDFIKLFYIYLFSFSGLEGVIFAVG